MGQLLVLLALTAGFSLVFWSVASYVLLPNAQEADAVRMRHVYVALALYEQANDGQPAPNLLAVRRDLGADGELLAENDPFKAAYLRPFPVEPGMPGVKVTSPARISFSYLGNYARAGKIPLDPWPTLRMNVRMGILACGWYGDIVPSGTRFVAAANGPIQRINMDGSVFHLQQRQDRNAFSAQDLFVRR